MNANSQPKTPAIKDWLSSASQQLSEAEISSARLDSEIILASVLQKSRTYLHAHDNDLLSEGDSETASAHLKMRLNRVPIAYIIGYKDFYGRSFCVTTDTLVPRPESEDIITILKERYTSTGAKNSRFIDIGTGSGCLGITAKLEIPELDVTLADISPAALAVAAQNATALNANVKTLQSDLLASYPYKADYIIANLPYVDITWRCSPETKHEPSLALFADDSGFDLINKLIEQTYDHLAPGGLLLLESDARQHTAIVHKTKSHGLLHIETRGLITCFKKPV
jgi:release factor glutamine methyltransferase